jgi:hypothetical protein
MGLGKMVKITFSNKIKCDRCGSVIVDGSYEEKPRYTEKGGRLPSYGGDGVGFLNTLIYGSKKEILCDSCKRMNKVTDGIKKNYDKQMEEMMNRPDIKAQIDLERENLELNNLYLKQQLAAVNKNNPPPAINIPQPSSNRKSNFCSHCGGALKANARFCSGCGKSVN